MRSEKRDWRDGCGRSWQPVLAFFFSLLLSGYPALAQDSAPSASASAQSAQNQAPPSAAQQNQTIPDAPSTVEPSQPPPAPPPQASPDQNQQAPPSANAPAPGNAPASDNGQAPGTAPSTTGQQPPADQPVNPGQRPPINVRTVPQGGSTKADTGQEQLFTITKNVNQVVIPVTVKDEAGHLVNGLTSRDFSVLENGKKQTLNFFTSDPFALSAAVIIDTGMKDVDLQKVNRTFPALEGAFSQFDEVSLYTFSNTVGQLSGWGAVGPRLSAELDSLRKVRGQNNGPPVTDGPFGPQGPMINDRPVDPSAPIVYTPVQEAHVLNDAVLRAAVDLSQRDKTRRKVIFIISDGREYRSSASYRDVLRVLLTNNILVYAIDPGGSAIPGYNTLSKLHIPRLGYSDILPKYVNATTGSKVLNELTRTGIEDAYTQALGDARNQYTLGYVTHTAAAGGYRDIEILVDRPSCRSSIRPCVNVSAKAGYYPAPPGR